MTNLKRQKFQAHPFHLVSPSPWPFYTSISLLTLTCAGVLTMHGFSYASYFLFLALATLILSMALWCIDVTSKTTIKYFSLVFDIFIISLVISFTICLIFYPQKRLVSFLAEQLDLPYLAFINAILWIRPIDIVRCHLQGKNTNFNLIRFIFPFTIICLVWLITILDFLSFIPTGGLSYFIPLLPWNLVQSWIGNGLFSLTRNNYQFAGAGRPGSFSDPQNFIPKLIPTSLFMEDEQLGGSKKGKGKELARPEGLNPSETSIIFPSTSASALGTDIGLGSAVGTSSELAPSSVSSTEPIGDDRHSIGDISQYNETTQNTIRRNKITWIVRTYQGPRNIPIIMHRWGMEYVPCPKGVTNFVIGESGNIKFVQYYNSFHIEGIIVNGDQNILRRGWCSDGTQSNQPIARYIADLLLAAETNGNQHLRSNLFESPDVVPFIFGAINEPIKAKKTITLKMIKALRSSD